MANDTTQNGNVNTINTSGYTADQWIQRIQTDFSFSMPNREQIGTIQQSTDRWKEFVVQLAKIYPPQILGLIVTDLLKIMYVANTAFYKYQGSGGVDFSGTDYNKKVG